ncbi:MoxR family ATPase [bacterium]|nr:MoxR family ATPase [bacterium]
MSFNLEEMNTKISQESVFIDRLTKSISEIVVGQRNMIRKILIGILSDGHILLEGVPGLAKTLAVKTFSDAIDADFQRIQFTPDLLPADLLGTLIYNQNSGSFETKKGPIFANIILADEINRSPAKVQSALLEAMQEKQVTIGNDTFPLPKPFLVLATQNPIEQEGTYPLPEAQVDRFMLKIRVTYPTRDEESEIIRRMTASELPEEIKAEISLTEIEKARQTIREIYVDEKIKNYVLDIIFATRNPENAGLKEIADWINFGASPRASIFLITAAKANAFLNHRGFVTPEDIRSVGFDVLRHRIITTYEAEAENIQSEDIIQQLFDQIAVP